MLPRIGIPWYRARIKQSVFEDASSPRGFNIQLPKVIIPPKVKLPEYVPVGDLEWNPAYSPVGDLAWNPAFNPQTSPVPGLSPSTVPGFAPSPVPNPATQPNPSPVPNPATQPNPSPVPNPATQPNPTPVPTPATQPNPRPIILPPPIGERGKEGNLNPAPSLIQQLEAQKEAQRQIINDKAYKQLVQYDMLIERNLAQRKLIEQNSKLTTSNLRQYDTYLKQQSISVDYNNIPIPRLIADKQIKAFNETMKKIEINIGKGKDIILDYISNNEITLGTLPHHYKELNKQIAKAGVTGLAIGTVAYILYNLAKVAIVL